MMRTTQSADVYQSLSDIEHVLKRPDMWINSLSRAPRIAKCLNPAEMKITQRQIYLCEGQEQVFVEIIGNAADNTWESRELNIDPGVIEVDVNPEWFTVKNYGLAIPISQNELGMWIPQSIFGNLRSSSKYNDDKKRYLIGKNGLGSKLTNIYSRCFAIECADAQRGLLYKQNWQNNMSVVSQPEITQYQGPGYTKVSVSLDFARFGVTGYDQEALEVYAGHCAAISYTCQVPVIFNGYRFEIKDLVGYAGLFYTVNRSSAISYKDPNGVYDLCIIDTPNDGDMTKVGAVCASFVNGIVTSNGGVHVDAAYKVIVKAILDFLGKNAEGIRFTKADVANHISLFISCRLDKPEYTSQIKDCLKKPTPNIELPENLLKGIKKWQLIQTIYAEVQRKQINKMKSKDGKRKKRPRTDDSKPANLAGGPRSMEATLILTEGKSADSYRLKFISQVPNGMGREFFGSLPLHGKILNVLNADFLQILEHKDLEAIRVNLGLKTEVDYSLEENWRKLNYGSLLIMPDPDNDGKHILGLVLLFFLHFYPGLVQRGYVKFLRIPVVRISINKQPYSFYSMSSFKRFMAQLPQGVTIDADPDYFKGLGSSEDHHIRQDFANPRFVVFKIDEVTGQKILLAFHKTASDQRKQWIANWVNRELLDTDNCIELPISIFIDHEFIDYSIENIIRSIPEAMDGLKESQRKVMFAALKTLGGKKNKKKYKVAQIANHAAKITNYKHGESCLSDTVVQMTYNFVGSNNCPYFFPVGQFGCVDPETPILLWDGSWKIAKNITIEDILVGDDGQPRHISKVVSGVDHMYTVNQNYGLPYKINSQHILTLRFSKHKRIYWKGSSNKWCMEYYDTKLNTIKSKEFSVTKTRTKEQANQLILDFADSIPDDNIFDINLQTYLSFPSSRLKLFTGVYNTKSIDWPKQEVPVDPYCLGMWLGDGRSNGCGFTSMDPELIKSWVIWLDTIDTEVAHHKSGEKGFHYGFRKKGYLYGNSYPIGHKDNSSKICGACNNSTNIHPSCDWVYDKRVDNTGYVNPNDSNRFVDILQEHNLFENKHIPQIYIINDEETRLQLLAGLIDTDGTLGHPDEEGSQLFEICQEINTHGHIIDKAEFVARSLGFKTTNSISVRSDSTLKRLRIMGDIHRIPTRLSRKQATRSEVYAINLGIKVEYTGVGEYVGWYIDGNERFLHGDFTVLHNTREGGGEDSANPRYTSVSLPWWSHFMYRPEDKRLEVRIEDEGEKQECENLFPILPMHVINGVVGIGTAYSTNIPNHNPMDVAFWLQQRLLQDVQPEAQHQLPLIHPWYKGFKGPITLTPNGFTTEGIIKYNNNQSIVIEELPIGRWTEKYEKDLVKMEEEGKISGFDMYCTDENIKILIHSYLDGAVSLKKLKLISKHSYNNMTVLYRTPDRGIQPRIYNDLVQLLQDFYTIRLAKYVERKIIMLKEFDEDIRRLSERARYIHAVAVEKTLEVRDRLEADVLNDMVNMRFDLKDELLDKVKTKELCKDKIPPLLKKIQDKIDEKARVENTSPQAMWYSEIEEFVVKYCREEKCNRSTMDSCNPMITLTLG
jgi:DNA gyrase/topoisomerase IV subunit B